VAGNGELNERLRRLPAVDAVMAELSGSPPQVVVQAAREAVETARRGVLEGGEPPGIEEVVATARSLLTRHERSLLRPVINATGVLLHTNLGRAPLGERQLEAVRRIAGGYSNLEYDLNVGRRGDRYAHARSLLKALTGAESALVVNNNAAAVLLVLASLCRDREVIISRGELIEIGGEFRIPDVMAQSGARLVEVGTTNRTHIGDYERAITPDTAAILKVHMSNYRIVGFTRSVETRDLARLGRGRGVLLINDLGSGLIEPAGRAGDALRGEPPVEVALGNGADVVMFSGDKLLGGPQAGVILGRATLIETIGRHPLLRALRVDKMTLAALEETLLSYLESREDEVPVWALLNSSTDELRARADRIVGALNQTLSEGFKVTAVPTHSVTGGGSLPGADVESWAIALVHAEKSPNDLQSTLLLARMPVIGRIEDDRLLLDLRAISPDMDDALLSVLHSID
jgi:L-seryl-tRNA(Ser) seleniumtransferase